MSDIIKRAIRRHIREKAVTARWLRMCNRDLYRRGRSESPERTVGFRYRIRCVRSGTPGRAACRRFGVLLFDRSGRRGHQSNAVVAVIVR